LQRHLVFLPIRVKDCETSRTWFRALNGALATRGVDSVVLEVCRYDPVSQVLDKNHVRIGSDGIILGPISLRQAHPPEFDLMARIAGLRLRNRWGGWD